MRLKLGDSFWYERPVGPQAFTKGNSCYYIKPKPIFIVNGNSFITTVDQLQQIYDTSLAAIICRNSDAVNRSPGEVMRRVSRQNPVLNCSQLDTFSFLPWREMPMGQMVHVSIGEAAMRVGSASDITTVSTTTSANNVSLFQEMLEQQGGLK